ncbi:hypothetical protein [Antarctobacter sp.]|uniref:hypothetical protein n=1 Tax=Antarctobacter sp. TaxID=1872577 RepID=UPI003A8CF05E
MALLDNIPAAAPKIRPLAALGRLFGRLLDHAITPDSADEDRARRAFLQDMIGNCPDAFASEADVHSMMHMYSRRF